MMLRILVFAEAEADARLGCDLGDRILLEEGPEWLAGLELDDLRAWTDVDGNPGFTRWTRLREKGNGHGPRFLRRQTSGPVGSDYAMAVKALLRVQESATSRGTSRAVVMLRDCDASDDKRAGLRQAAAEPRFADFKVILGIADKMREAWVLNGFVAKTDEECKTLRRLRAELGFDPVGEAQRLRASMESDPRHPKRVLAELTKGDPQREARCWLEPSLEILRRNGKETGLAQYLDDLCDCLGWLLKYPGSIQGSHQD